VAISPDPPARVFAAGQQEEDSTIEGLTAAANYLRRELNNRISLRRMPQLSFRRDDSMEKGAHILDLLNQISEEPEKP
jgi:ribosome-binding factor A